MGWRDWTGVGERRWKAAPDEQVQPSKTLWDLLQLLIVPVILVGISLWWSSAQDARDDRQAAQLRASNERQEAQLRERDERQADQLRQDTTLNDYLQQMSDLMLDRELLFSKEGDAVRSVARTLTLTTLPRLDGERKAIVLRFLGEAELPIFDLTGESLSGADLAGAFLMDADLTGAFLPFADLTGAFLPGANLTDANLTEANLTGADLTDADLTGAVLLGADLTDADLTGANLSDALYSSDTKWPVGFDPEAEGAQNSE